MDGFAAELAAQFAGLPLRQGLYDPTHEKDACGIGVIVNIAGTKSHSIVKDGLTLLDNLKHRGAQGSDPLTGDGCGILTQIPDAFFRSEFLSSLPSVGHYAVGMIFSPKTGGNASVSALVDELAIELGLKPLGWRTVPVNSSTLGPSALKSEPVILQFFLERPVVDSADLAFERRLYTLRRKLELQIPGISLPSLSSSKIVYKGLLLPERLSDYFLDLAHPLF